MEVSSISWRERRFLGELFFERVDFSERVFEGFAERRCSVTSTWVPRNRRRSRLVCGRMAEDVKMANGAVVEDDAVVQFEIAGVRDGLLDRFMSGGAIVGVNAARIVSRVTLLSGSKAKDAIAFLAEIDNRRR